MLPTTEPALATTADLVPLPPADGQPDAQIAPTRRRRTLRALASDVGQGTVEYVGLLLLMATILASVVAVAGSLKGEDKIGKQVVNQIGSSIDKAGGGQR